MIHTTTIRPGHTYDILRLMREANAARAHPSDELAGRLIKLRREIEEDYRKVDSLHQAILWEEDRTTLRIRNPFASPEADTPNVRDRGVRDSFIPVYTALTSQVLDVVNALIEATMGLCPERPWVDIPDKPPTTADDLSAFNSIYRLYGSDMRDFVSHVFKAERAAVAALNLVDNFMSIMDGYYIACEKRHTREGIKVHGDPIATDLAIQIVRNVDRNGEIKGGKDPSEVSAWAISKAKGLVESIRSTSIGNAVNKSGMPFMDFVEIKLKALFTLSLEVASPASILARNLRRIIGRSSPDTPRRVSFMEFDAKVQRLKSIDPRHIVYKEPNTPFTPEERDALDRENETIAMVVDRLREGKVDDLVDVILKRKAEVREFEVEENSFYTCKIAAGNTFFGVAPGALEVLPSPKPNVNLDRVVGKGFDEVRDFIAHVDRASHLDALFRATSPSGKLDKNNLLLVGPQGCGKTESLRAVASMDDAIGIFAQASDFLTCWKGEAEKNPKRLFEEAIKIQRESGKPVFILIDEIDTVLNSDRGQQAFGGINLSSEFQQLMDGVTSYPNLAVWGATNYPERIPAPMLRRFAKVLIVGELDRDDRIALLKQFASTLPVSEDITQEDWTRLSNQLDGAVGDTIRKIVDHVWRVKMGSLVDTDRETADKLVETLNEITGGQLDMRHFDDGQRETFKAVLRPHVEVTASDLQESIKVHLANQAIRREIDVAKATYERARHVLAGIAGL